MDSTHEGTQAGDGRERPARAFDTAGFRAICAAYGIDTQVVAWGAGVRLDRKGLEQLRDTAAAHGAIAIAAAIAEAIAGRSNEGGRHD
jgi:hypothetical protein